MQEAVYIYTEHDTKLVASRGNNLISNKIVFSRSKEVLEKSSSETLIRSSNII
jgi:hypothetical protein